MPRLPGVRHDLFPHRIDLFFEYYRHGLSVNIHELPFEYISKKSNKQSNTQTHFTGKLFERVSREMFEKTWNTYSRHPNKQNFWLNVL